MGANIGSPAVYAAGVLPKTLRVTVRIIPVGSTCVTIKSSAPICKKTPAARPVAGTGGGSAGVVVGLGVVVAPGGVAPGAVVVGACIAATIVSCVSVTAASARRIPTGPRTSAPGGWFVAVVPRAPRITPSCKPVASIPLTLITSESTEMNSGAPPGSGTSSTICVSSTPTFCASEDIFGAAAEEPGTAGGGGTDQSCCLLSIQNLRPLASMSIRSAHVRDNRHRNRIVCLHIGGQVAWSDARAVGSRCHQYLQQFR